MLYINSWIGLSSGKEIEFWGIQFPWPRATKIVYMDVGKTSLPSCFKKLNHRKRKASVMPGLRCSAEPVSREQNLIIALYDFFLQHFISILEIFLGLLRYWRWYPA